MDEQKHIMRAMQGGANADLLREIRSVMHRLPEMTVKWVKVKAHRKMEAEKYHEVINDEMDTLANTLHDNIAWQSKETAHHFTSEPAELKIWGAHHGYTRITGNVGKSLQRSSTTHIMATKLKECEGWEHEIFENIDWQSRATTIRGMKDNNKKQIFKMSHGALPVMRQQERCEYSDTTTCPVCKYEEDTITHILRCQILSNPEWKREL